MDHRRVFSLDPKRFPVSRMQDLVKYLHGRDQRYIMMVDPAVAEYDYRAYNRGVELDVFLKAPSKSTPFRGVVWPVRGRNSFLNILGHSSSKSRESLYGLIGSMRTLQRTGPNASKRCSARSMGLILMELGT